MKAALVLVCLALGLASLACGGSGGGLLAGAGQPTAPTGGNPGGLFPGRQPDFPTPEATIRPGTSPTTRPATVKPGSAASLDPCQIFPKADAEAALKDINTKVYNNANNVRKLGSIQDGKSNTTPDTAKNCSYAESAPSSPLEASITLFQTASLASFNKNLTAKSEYIRAKAASTGNGGKSLSGLGEDAYIEKTQVVVLKGDAYFILKLPLIPGDPNEGFLRPVAAKIVSRLP